MKASSDHAPRGGVAAYVSVMRPDHWLKNVFIVFGHAAAVVLLKIPITLELVMLAAYSLLPACLVASANYIINEILDAPYDRVHPTKKHRAVASGEAKEPVLWVLFGLLVVGAWAMSFAVFNPSYQVSLLLLLLSGLAYNVRPLRLKDRAFLDVIAESFNNPVRLWLGWYSVAPPSSFPPLSVILAWWMFGALLMTGKRYAEYRFIADPERSGAYRKSFRVYTEKSLLIAMITYANLFCFCAGAAVAIYKPNLLFVFPLIIAAIIAYFNAAITAEGARLEPEQLLKNPWIIASTLAVALAGAALVWLPWNLVAWFGFFRLITGK